MNEGVAMKRSTRTVFPGALAFLLSVLLAPPATGAEEVWSIGKADGSHGEFALGRGSYEQFPKRFGDVVEFRVGRSRPERDFPYVHPGPMDRWAGSKPHSFKIQFDLTGEPSGVYLLTLHINKTHYAFPPLLNLAANGAAKLDLATPKDAEGLVRYWRIPAGALRAGANEITIRNGRGSWMEYDSIRLDRFPGEIPDLISKLRLSDSILFIAVEGELSQMVRAEVDGLWDGRGTFRLKTPSGERTVPAEKARSPLGGFEIPVGLVEKPAEVTCELIAASGARASASVMVQPHRRWKIYAAMKTHYDLGYTHPVEEMLAIAAGPMLEKIMEYCDESRGNPPGSRFLWNYPSWLIGKIRELLPEEKKKIFGEYIRRGEINWNALPFSLHSYFCGLEDIVRATYLSARLNREFGTQVRWAKQTDVPGHTRFYPQILKKSGIRLLQIGANNGVRGVRIPLLFRWESPDGSRILTQLTGAYGVRYSENLLRGLEQNPDYPYDAFLALYVTGDNVGPGNLNSVAALARHLNDRYVFPRFQIGGVEDFAEYIEKNFADRVPVVRKEITDWWIHGVASMARETALARAARERLTAAEKINTIALLLNPGQDYPGGDFRKAYEQSLLYSEHTWGVAGFKPKPLPPEKRDLETNQSDAYKKMRHSWKVKGDYARKASEISRKTLLGGLAAAVRAAGVPGGMIVVYNPLNWTRSDLVRISREHLPRESSFTIHDLLDEEVPWQSDDGDVVFLARHVPPCGWAGFRIKPTKRIVEVPGRSEGEPLLEAGGFRIAFDTKTGAVRSLKYRDEELVDGKAPFQLNQFVYEGRGRIGEAGWHGSPYDGPPTGRRVPAVKNWRIVEGPVFSRFIAEGALEIADIPVEVGSVPRVVQMVTVTPDLGWIECETRLYGKRPSALAETGHVVFPFLVPGGKFRLELLGSVVDPERDLQDFGNRDCFAVQHWVDVSNGKRGITWCPLETTITSLGDFRLFRWDPAYVPENTRIYSNVFNNGWSTNFQEWQGGDFRSRYRFRPHRGDFVKGAAPRFGWETSQPLIALVTPAGENPPPEQVSILRGSFLLADSRTGTTVLVNLKRAEDGRGVVARLFETSGSADEVRLSFPGRDIRSAARTLLTELPLEEPGGGKLEIRDGAVAAPVGPFAIETIRLAL